MSDVSTSEKQSARVPEEEMLERERTELLQRLADWLETPMLLLAFVWLALLVAELTWGETAHRPPRGAGRPARRRPRPVAALARAVTRRPLEGSWLGDAEPQDELPRQVAT